MKELLYVALRSADPKALKNGLRVLCMVNASYSAAVQGTAVCDQGMKRGRGRGTEETRLKE
jgi:hypothetical protein